MQRHHLDRASVLAIGLALALPLAACGRSGTNTAANTPSSQVADEAQTATTVDAPAPSALPEATPVPVALPADAVSAYEPEDDAFAEDDAIDYGPPDYDFDYDGVEPWVWEGGDDSLLFVEPIVGGYRDYYYRPGAINPYLIRDNDYTYGYQRGQLVAVYDRSGRSLPPDQVRARAATAGRYLARASGLRGAWRSQPHRAVPAQAWARREPGLTSQRTAWSAGQARQSDWQAYHVAHATEQQQHWAPLAARRVQVAATVQAHADPRAAAAFRHQTDAFRRARPQAFAANQPAPAIAAAVAQRVRADQPRQQLALQRGQADQGRAAQQQAQRAEADQARLAQAQAARGQAQQAQRAQAQQARAAQQQAQRAEAQQGRAAQQQAQRAQADQARLAQAQAARGQAQQAQRAQAQQARAAQQQAQRAQAQQARAAQQQAQRAQAEQARGAQQQAQRAQAEQARAAQQQAQRAQAQQAQRAQAQQARAAQQQAQRAQAEQARAAQQQAQRAQAQQAQQAQRAQAQQARAAQQQAQRAQAEQARAAQAAQAAQAHMAQVQAHAAQAAARAQAQAQAPAAAPHPGGGGPPPKRHEPHA